MIFIIFLSCDMVFDEGAYLHNSLADPGFVYNSRTLGPAIKSLSFKPNHKNELVCREEVKTRFDLYRLRGGMSGCHIDQNQTTNQSGTLLQNSDGALDLAFKELSEEQLCLLDGNLTGDGGVRVVLSHRGPCWRKPSSCDEVLISYNGSCDGTVFTSSNGPALIQLGQNLLPAGLELAITRSFTRFSRGRVLLSPAYAVVASAPPPGAAAGAALTYEVRGRRAHPLTPAP